MSAITFLRDTVGEKPKDEVEISSSDVININIVGNEEESSESDKSESEQEPIHE